MKKIAIITLLLFSNLFSKNINDVNKQILNILNNSCIYSKFHQKLPFILTNDNYIGTVYAYCINNKITLIIQKNKMEYSVLQNTKIECSCKHKEKLKFIQDF